MYVYILYMYIWYIYINNKERVRNYSLFNHTSSFILFKQSSGIYLVSLSQWLFTSLLLIISRLFTIYTYTYIYIYIYIYTSLT